MSTKRIKLVGCTLPRIVDTSAKCERIDPKWLAEQLGAEIVRRDELSPRWEAIMRPLAVRNGEA